ncbi:alpha-1,3-galactosidase B [Bacteroidia bacterium]|nr:alpha-1,3-galactosidase B [Bacteroidia bacterium]
MQAAFSADATEAVRKAIAGAPRENIRIVFPKGDYHFRPDHACGKFHNITNHTSGHKYIALDLEAMRHVEIDGQGSRLLMHGTMLPILISGCTNVVIRNISIDWPSPFTAQGTVTAVDMAGHTYDLKMHSEGLSWKVEDGRLKFPVDQGFTYSSAGESLLFDPRTGEPVYGAGNFDLHRRSDVRAEKQPDGTIRIWETARLKTPPPTGSVMTFKGPMGENRYAPAIHCTGSEGVRIENVTVNHALGMGFLAEKSKDITLSRFDVVVPPGSGRMVSATADATHFCNCRGDVLVENCRFENMLDDGTNVHGTYLEIEQITGARSVVATLKHFQQAGFIFGSPGDQVWMLSAPSTERSNLNTIASFTAINELCSEIVFLNDLPKGLKPGDLIENKTWNTSSFVLRNCTIRKHRARNIVLKAPGKVVIENNHLQSMMASVLVRGEASQWYESGASTDITIRGNTFENCALGGGNQAVITIQPRINRRFDQRQPFDSNITIERNRINTFDNMIVTASNVEGLSIKNNDIADSRSFAPFNSNAPLIDISLCSGVIIEGNSYSGGNSRPVKTDAVSEKGARISNNDWKAKQ